MSEFPTNLGRIVLDEMRKVTVIEQHGWAPESVERVANRLQQDSPLHERFEVVVYWSEEFNAFTVPGDVIFISRHLLERCRTDEMIALVIGHEIAHHELGHISAFPDWYPEFARNTVGYIACRLAQIPQRMLEHPQMERDADARGIELCLAAGYDPHECIKFFEVAREKILNRGGIDSVFGRDDILDDEPSLKNLLVHRARIWLDHHRTGYPCLLERQEQAIQHVEDLLSAPEGTQVSLS